MIPELVTERMLLRPLTLDDTTMLHPIFADAEVMRFWSSGPHSVYGDTIENVALAAEQEPWLTWAIALPGDELIGWVSLGYQADTIRELGTLLQREHWGRGLMREAVSTVLDYAFDKLSLQIVTADTDPANVTSIGLLHSLGFREDEDVRAQLRMRPMQRDSILYAMHRNEWQDRQGSAAA